MTKTVIYENETWRITEHFDGVWAIESCKELKLGEPKVNICLVIDEFESLYEIISKIGRRSNHERT